MLSYSHPFFSQVAASGGYMMACIADWLLVAPFAMLGSIGVVGGIPNFNKALRKAGIEYFHFTAGDLSRNRCFGLFWP